MTIKLQASASFTEAAPLPTGNYSFFKLKKPLTINRRGKPVAFKRGDNLGWRYSSNGKSFRLISPMTGPNVVFSIPITDESLVWLTKQAPEAKHKAPRPGKPAPGNEGRMTEYYFTRTVVPDLKKHCQQVLRNILARAKELGVKIKIKDESKDPRAVNFDGASVAYTPYSLYLATKTEASIAFYKQLSKALNRKKYALKVGRLMFHVVADGMGNSLDISYSAEIPRTLQPT